MREYAEEECELAALTDTVAYVLPWVPDVEQAMLHAYDLTADGRLLWQLDVSD